MNLRLPRQQRPPAWAPTAFVSYSHANAPIMEMVVTHLRRDGIYVLGDADYMETGADYLGIVRQLIERAHVFVFLLSVHSLSSQACQTELETAQSKGKTLLLARIEPAVDVAGTAFEGIEIFDLTDPDQNTLDAFAKLVRDRQPSTLRRMLGI